MLTPTSSPTPKRRKPRPWLLLSIVVHLLVLGVLVFIFVDPPKPIDERRKEQLEQLSRQKLEEAADRLREINREELVRNVRHLERIRDELEEIEKEKVDELTKELTNRPAEALAAALELVDRVLAEQGALVEAQRENQQKLAEAGAKLVAAVGDKGDADDDRLKSFADGKGREALENYAKQEAMINAADGSVQQIQQMQVQLADELSWLDRADLTALQTTAIKSQESAKNQNRETHHRLEWLGRDTQSLASKAASALKKTSRGRSYAVDNVQQTIGRQAEHVGEVDKLQPQAIQKEETALAAQLALKEALLAVPPPRAAGRQEAARRRHRRHGS